MKKKLLALLLALVMVVSMMPAFTLSAAATNSITVYVTASYEGEALTSTGSGANSSTTDKMIYKAVELTSASPTVRDALEKLANDYYNTDGSGASISGEYISDYWNLYNNGTSTSYIGSAVLLNGVEQTYGSVGASVSDGDCIMLSLYDYLTDYSGSISTTYIGDPDGIYIASASVITGNSLNFGAYSGGSAISSGCSLYVTSDLDSLGTALTSNSYAFSTAGTYYIVAKDINAGSSSAVYGLSSSKITVADSIVNSAPTRRSNVSGTASANVYVGQAYTLTPSTIFKDTNGDNLTYKVSVNGGTSTEASSSYSYTPTAAGIYTLAFKANDGTVDSTDTYTVTLNVTAPPTAEIALSGLSAYYAAGSYLPFGSDPSFDWAIADIAAYDPSLITDSLKQDYVDYIVYHASSSSSAADLARYIITLKALGYDATKIDSTGSGSYFNAVEAMNDLIGTTTSIYTLPYMLIALQQYGDSYSTQIDALITSILNAELPGGGWNGYGAGIDADSSAPVLIALAPYYSTNPSVQTAVDNALALISNLQGGSGAIESSWTNAPDPSSTGLMIAGLAALGQHSTTFITNESLVDGLLLLYNGSTDLFGAGANSYADEQGFRGLVAASKYSSSGYRIYDFTGNASNATVASAYYTNCLVSFSLIPSTATVSVTADSGSNTVTPMSTGKYDLTAGTYNYSVSKDGYTTKTGNFSVTAAEANHTRKDTISVSLTSVPVSSTDITVNVYVKTHGDHSTGTYTYKNNSSVYSNIVNQTVTLRSGCTVFDALDAALTAAGKTYVEGSSGYIETIDGLSEFDHSSNSGWLYKVNGITAESSSRNYTLTGNSTVIWFYTDDFTSEYGSEKWSSSAGGIDDSGSSVLIPDATVKAGEVTANVTGDDMDKAIESVIADGAREIIVKVETDEDITKWTGSIDTNAVKSVTSKTDASLVIDTLVGRVEMSNDILASIAEQAQGDNIAVSFELKSEDNAREILAGAEGISADEVDLTSSAVVEISITSGGEKITYFDGRELIISLPVDSTKYGEGETYKVYVISDDGTVEVLVGKVSVNNGIAVVEVAVKHLSTFIITSETVCVFKDVPINAWFYGAVNYVTAKGLFAGTSETAFEPDTFMTRAMLVTVLARMSKANLSACSTTQFSDVAIGTWYGPSVAWAKEAGIISGYEGADGSFTFKPDAYISRQDMAVMIKNYLEKVAKEGLSETKAAITFTDTGRIADYAKTAVSAMQRAGIINGVINADGNYSFLPADNATRAQMATMIYIMLTK